MRNIKRGQVFWWYPTKPKEGHIQAGTRPAIVVSNDVCNMNSPVVTIVPATTACKRPYPQHAPFVMQGEFNLALGDQITSIPVVELGDYICTLKDFQMEQVERAILVQLGFIQTEYGEYTQQKQEEAMNVKSPEPKKQKPKTGKKHIVWNDDNILQFLIDFDELGLKGVVAKYGLSEATVIKYRIKFQKKIGDK